MSELNGVLPVDKPEGPTSHDVVAQARRALGLRRIGHTGTLDPFASGVLLLCLGPATRLAEYLTALPKRYTATIRLGVATDTDDRTGEPIEVSEGWADLGEAEVREALQRQVGEILQRPPAYSAKKVDGERMYAAARRGVTLEREPVAVRIDAIRVLRIALPEVDVEIDCGSGTYIRAIARDLGEELRVGGHLTALRRTRVGVHDVAGALPLQRLDDGDAVAAALLSPAAALAHLPALRVRGEDEAPLRNGRPLRAGAEHERAREGGPVALISGSGALLAVGERVGEEIRPRKVFA